MPRYRIFRVYSDGRRRKTLEIVYDEQTAKKYCADPATKGGVGKVTWYAMYEKIQEEK